jgi:hypothetical protein
MKPRPNQVLKPLAGNCRRHRRAAFHQGAACAAAAGGFALVTYLHVQARWAEPAAANLCLAGLALCLLGYLYHAKNI